MAVLTPILIELVCCAAARSPEPAANVSNATNINGNRNCHMFTSLALANLYLSSDCRRRGADRSCGRRALMLTSLSSEASSLQGTGLPIGAIIRTPREMPILRFTSRVKLGSPPPTSVQGLPTSLAVFRLQREFNQGRGRVRYGGSPSGGNDACRQRAAGLSCRRSHCGLDPVRSRPLVHGGARLARC